ncbi:lytic transglycosylase domain-containing protein [Sphingomonas sp. PP-CC-3A-396]|uniref:lytic transglycosylase domain-containing protein n=1 Tax=Sphingomonas sp. PP-CC-3A-396 TaxID=2135655 RepID=UPI001045D623|nr:lytic transglycosylase domain-containing protein [Sphingomonas sp. PP-CC-3A-396]TCQ05087.1 soluble lytic murein transglycosylase-like protein [Sphingomonas sp. PP-CC-3A-396]
MIRTLAIVLGLSALPFPALAATVAGEPSGDARLGTTQLVGAPTLEQIPDQLDAGQREAYKTVFAAIRDGKWTDAQIQLDTMKPGPLHAIARAEMYTAKGSPKVEMEPLVALLNEAPELPEAEQIARLASMRGAVGLPPLPVAQRLIWQDGAPRRVRAKSLKGDMIAADLALKMQPYVKADMGREAQSLLESTPGLTPEALTEWQQKIAWIYFLQGDDVNARVMATKAQDGVGDWAVQGRWVNALSAWRQNDCANAESGFEGVAARAGDVDLRAAALYWASRADMVCSRPDKIEGRLKAAAQFSESFYGQLARQQLAMKDKGTSVGGLVASDWKVVGKRPNVRVAAALVEVGETDLADTVIRQQAKIGDPREFGNLVRVAEALSLPATTVFLAHNCPQGVTSTAEARYPTPNWTPDSGWHIDKALVYAHTLEESRFRNTVKSPAGAYGLMQIMPAAATDFARERGTSIDMKALTKPSTNMDIGQRHLERLRDMAGVTGGLLPKVIAAYNAGPRPVGDWNAIVHDNGDPLMYIESIPYWETRGYVTTVLRNYWMYEAQGGKKASVSRNALAQGMWPRFPGLPGATAVRMATKPYTQYRATTAPLNATVAVNASVGPQSTTVTRAD